MKKESNIKQAEKFGKEIDVGINGIMGTDKSNTEKMEGLKEFTKNNTDLLSKGIMGKPQAVAITGLEKNGLDLNSKEMGPLNVNKKASTLLNGKGGITDSIMKDPTKAGDLLGNFVKKGLMEKNPLVGMMSEKLGKLMPGLALSKKTKGLTKDLDPKDKEESMGAAYKLGDNMGKAIGIGIKFAKLALNIAGNLATMIPGVGLAVKAAMSFGSKFLNGLQASMAVSKKVGEVGKSATKLATKNGKGIMEKMGKLKDAKDVVQDKTKNPQAEELAKMAEQTM